MHFENLPNITVMVSMDFSIIYTDLLFYGFKITRDFTRLYLKGIIVITKFIDDILYLDSDRHNRNFFAITKISFVDKASLYNFS